MLSFSQKKPNLKLSSIQEHNIHQNTDKLYSPLRNLLINPETATAHKAQSPQAALSTRLFDPYKQLTREDVEIMKNDILIPTDKQLIPTDHLQKIKDSRMRVIDAYERVIGQPISQQQMETIRKNQTKKQSKIVYEFADTSTNNLNQLSNGGDTLKSQIINNTTTLNTVRSDGNLFGPDSNKNLSSIRTFKYLKLSNIIQHNIYYQTDKLYDPLRSVLNQPQVAIRHYAASPKAPSCTLLKDPYQRISYADASILKNNIMIPMDRELIPTNHLQAIMSKKFRVVDAYQKISDRLLSQAELNQMLKKGKKTQQIVYELGQNYNENEMNKNLFKPWDKVKKSSRKPQLTIMSEQINKQMYKNTIIPPNQNKNDYLKPRQNYKYNIFGCLENSQHNSCCGKTGTCCGKTGTCCGKADTCCGKTGICCEKTGTCCGKTDICCGKADTCCGKSGTFCGKTGTCCGENKVTSNSKERQLSK